MVMRISSEAEAKRIRIELFPFMTDNKKMLERILHIAMIAAVLACPALGGRCCDARNSSVTAGMPAVDVHEAHCCHDSELPEPACPAEGGECHDCFCAGALPIGPSALDSLSFDSLSFDFVVYTPASTLASLHRASARLDVCQWPPTTGERLATLGTLLI